MARHPSIYQDAFWRLKMQKFAAKNMLFFSIPIAVEKYMGVGWGACYAVGSTGTVPLAIEHKPSTLRRGERHWPGQFPMRSCLSIIDRWLSEFICKGFFQAQIKRLLEAVEKLPNEHPAI